MQTTRFAVDDILNIKRETLAVQEILKGTFDDEMARIEAARADLDAKLSLYQTVEQANAFLADAQAKHEQAQAAVAEAMTRADQVTKAETDLAQRERDLASARGKLESDRTVFEASKAAAMEVMAQRSAALDARESAVSKGESDLAAAQAQLDADRTAFNRRLEALKV